MSKPQLDTGKELITTSLDFLHAGSNFSRDISYRVYRFSEDEFSKGSWNSYKANMIFKDSNVEKIVVRNL